MINIILAGSLLILSKAKGFALNDGPDCMDYVQDEGVFAGYLKPVGVCWYDNLDETEIGDPLYSYYQPRIYMCEQDDAGDKWAVEYEVGANCNATARKVATNNTFPCNGGANDTCSCTVGTPSTCDFYEETDYGWKWSETFEIICDFEIYETTRYVVNVCVGVKNNQYYGGYSRAFECATSGYGVAWSEQSYNSYCSTGLPTSAPSESPTYTVIDGETTTTENDSLFCSESECAGTLGPRSAPTSSPSSSPSSPSTTSTSAPSAPSPTDTITSTADQIPSTTDDSTNDSSTKSIDNFIILVSTLYIFITLLF